MAKIHSAYHKMGLLNVHVFLHTLEMLMEPDVDLNVNTVLIVPVEWLVFVSIVEIRAAVYADKMPNAMLLITFLCVLVK